MAYLGNARHWSIERRHQGAKFKLEAWTMDLSPHIIPSSATWWILSLNFYKDEDLNSSDNKPTRLDSREPL